MRTSVHSILNRNPIPLTSSLIRYQGIKVSVIPVPCILSYFFFSNFFLFAPVCLLCLSGPGYEFV